MGEPPASSRRQALFSRFSQRALSELSDYLPNASRRPAILLTGGFSNADIMASALSSRHADLLGIGRLSVKYPQLPKTLKHAQGKLESAQNIKTSMSTTFRWEEALELMLVSLWAYIPETIRPRFPKLIGAGVEMAAYTVAMRDLSRYPPHTGQLQAPFEPRIGHVIRMWFYVAPDSWNGCWIMATFIVVAALAMFLT